MLALYLVGTFVGDVAPTDRTDPTYDAVINPSTTTAATTTTRHVIWTWTHAVLSGTYANFYGMYVQSVTVVYIVIIVYV